VWVPEREKVVHGKKRSAASEGEAPAAGPQSDAAPNAILFVEQLPAATTAAMLTKLFSQFPGFKEVRYTQQMLSLSNAILFVEQLPAATTAAMLTKLFSQFPGFKEMRYTPACAELAPWFGVAMPCDER
jgi:hypothetical protein